MVNSQISLIALALAASVHALPLRKRIAQNISDSTKKWEAACDAAGGGLQCNVVAVAAFDDLLAAHGPCDQQNAADKMIDLAKQLGNDPKMIALAQVFTQQPRNTPSSQSVPYCQQPPRNAELNGLFQCQFAGANKKTFVGGIPVGQAGTIPFGLSAPVSPPGSCPAHPDGPVEDGKQLVDITQDPGVKNAAKGGKAAPAPAGIPAPDAPADGGSDDDSADDADPAPAVSPPPAASSSGDFHIKNGQDAQKLNAKFASFTADTACANGDQACIEGGFAQCVFGKFVVMGCAAGTKCFGLPLVNKPGTSLACTTEQDAQARIAASGATGGITGDGSAAAPPAANAAPAPAAPAPAPAAPAAAPASGDFHLKNGQDAQKLNAKFTGITASSSCTDGEQACINGGFAQCANGKFALLGCAAGTECAAVPLLLKPGTAVVCTTKQDAVDRIAASGAKGGLTGA